MGANLTVSLRARPAPGLTTALALVTTRRRQDSRANFVSPRAERGAVPSTGFGAIAAFAPIGDDGAAAPAVSVRSVSIGGDGTAGTAGRTSASEAPRSRMDR